MSAEVLELEARLKDYISGNMSNITDALDKYGKKFEEAGDRQKKSSTLMGQAMRELGDSWNIAKIAITGLVGSMGAMTIFNTTKNFVVGAREEFKEYAQLQLQLKTALGFTSAALNEQAKILGKKLVVDNEEITKVQLMLANYVKNEDQIKDLTPAVLDLAAATGKDMATAANLVAKSIVDDNSELGRFKIAVDGAKGSSERIYSVIDGISSVMKGQSLALAESRDWWDKLKISIDNAKESTWAFFTEKPKRQDYLEKHLKDIQKEIEFAEKSSKDKSGALISMWFGDEKRIEYLNRELERTRLELQQIADSEKPKPFVGPLPETIDQRKTREEIEKINKDASLVTLKRMDEDIATARKAASLAEIALEVDTSKQKLLELDLYYQEQQIKYRGNKEALLALDREYAAKVKRITNEIETERKEKEQKLLDEKALSYERNLARVQAANQRDSEYQNKLRDDAKNKEDDAKKKKIENIETISSMTFGTISALARASKASAAVQKTIDIAQATANTAIAVTKSLSTPWMIPFIIGMGTAQVALIASQKYSGGGIVGGGSSSQGDVVPAMLTPGEMVLNDSQQAALFNMLQPSTVTTNNSTRNISNSQAINLNISVGAGGNYDMNAARMTIDNLVPVIGDALVRAKNEGRLRDYESAR